MNEEKIKQFKRWTSVFLVIGIVLMAYQGNGFNPTFVQGLGTGIFIFGFFNLIFISFSKEKNKQRTNRKK